MNHLFIIASMGFRYSEDGIARDCFEVLSNILSCQNFLMRKPIKVKDKSSAQDKLLRANNARFRTHCLKIIFKPFFHRALRFFSYNAYCKRLSI